ncbi:hypothetical protein BB558_005263 [Smittium angustum]|uniref:Uncharacterized protein n=1 Tax=Smittium angustum TaxID=133377 RepID=A0A2U1J0Y8_SMIAN|nr:hypothetical protein BB558_005857 [Smittium angustum]PVZ98725.1 hypothetical protein BB558_005263 [Smittium angustum]
MSSEKRESYIGVSIGNYNSVIAVLSGKEGIIDVIANEDGDHKTPTYLAFSDSELYSGSQAKHQSVYNHANTIVGFMEHLSKTSSEVVSDTAKNSCKLVTGKSGEPSYIITKEDGKQEEYTAYQILVKFVEQLKNTATKNLGSNIDGAVLSIHSGWSSDQINLFLNACKEASLPVLQLITESSAGILASGLLDAPVDELVIIANVGATKTDLSLTNVRYGIELPIDTISFSDFSGEKIDYLLMKHFADEFKRSSGIDVLANNKPREILKLRYGCEYTKHTLRNSSSNSVIVPCTIESLSGGIDFSSKITKLRFEMLCNKFGSVLEEKANELLKKNGYSPLEVSSVLFMGGSADASQKVVNKFMSLFPNAKKITQSHTLDEMVAVGCAKQAHLIHENNNLISGPTDFTIANVNSLTAPIGLKLSETSFLPVLQKQTPVPASRTIKVSLPPNSSEDAYFAICEGKANPLPTVNEDEDNEDEQPIPAAYSPSTLLGEFSLKVPTNNVSSEIEVTFFVDAQGQLTVSAKDLKSNAEASIQI